jgi:hypothetical protein
MFNLRALGGLQLKGLTKLFMLPSFLDLCTVYKANIQQHQT